jgi:hypothetical protein
VKRADERRSGGLRCGEFLSPPIRPASTASARAASAARSTFRSVALRPLRRVRT